MMMEAPMNPMLRRGIVFVLSSPSGAGKTTLARHLLASENVADNTIELSISVTTRPRRPNEVAGQDYEFVDREVFARRVAEGAFLEHAEVFGHCYGTLRAPVEQALASGRDLLFDVDWQGARELHRVMPDDLVAIFILPPSLPELEQRLRTRAQDEEAVIAQRMAKAVSEISHWRDYDYVLVNHDFASCLAQIRAILLAERLRRFRQTGLDAFIVDLTASQ